MPKRITVSERRHMARVASIGCIVCKNLGHGFVDPCLHHIREGQGMGQRAGNYLVLPLCPDHHQDGGHGVAIHAGQQTWERMYGTELELLDQVYELIQ